MSSVIDELKIVFSADTGALVAGLEQMGMRLGALEGLSMAAEASLQTLAAAFSGRLAGMSAEAYSAGSGAGEAFANGLLAQIGSVQGAAEATMQALAAAYASGMEGISNAAYSAGAGAGAAFAGGLMAQAGSVRSATAYLSATAMSNLGGSYSGGAAGADYAGAGSGAEATGFDASMLSGMANAAGSAASKVMEIAVPLNVDGVKLGEACIRAMERVAGITGRAHIAI